MTDLEQLWRQNREGDTLPENLMDEHFLAGLPSKLPLAKLKRNLFKSIVAAVFIALAYAGVLVFLHSWLVVLGVGILIIFNGWTIISGWRLFLQLPVSVTPAHSLKQELQYHVRSFELWWSQQVKVSLFIYPVAAAAGFVIGGMAATGHQPEFFLTRPRILLFLLLLIILLMPLCYWLDRLLYRHMYGRHLAALRQAIDELS